MNLLEMENEQLVSHIISKVEAWETHIEQYKTIWKRNYRLYRNRIEKEKPNRANLFIPYIWPIVEQLKARAIQALFTQKPYVSYVGVEEADMEGAKFMEKLVNFQMEEKINLPFKFIHALNSIFIYGTAIALYEWRLEEKKIKKKQDKTFLSFKVGEELVDELITTYDDPDVEFIPVDDFFYDPEGYDMKTCSYAGTKTYRDDAYLKKKAEQGIYKLPEDYTNDSSVIETNFRHSVTGITTSDDANRNKKHEVISFYTDDEVIVVLNRKYIIRKEENPSYSKEKPFKRIIAIPLEKEFHGEAIVSVLADLQEELNATRNQRIDNISLILNKMFLKRRGSDIDDADLVSRPYGVIEVGDLTNDLKPLDFPDVTVSAYNEEEIIKQDMQYISGVSEYARGATPERKETATTVTTIQQAANIIFNYTISVIERTGLLPLADAIKKLNQQYLTEEKVIRLFDQGSNAYNYSTIEPERIAGNYDVVSMSPRIEAEANKEVRRGQLLEMFNTFTTNQLTLPFINVPAFIKKIMEQYDIKDYQSLIIDPTQNQPPPTGESNNMPINDSMDIQTNIDGPLDEIERIGEENGY